MFKNTLPYAGVNNKCFLVFSLSSSFLFCSHFISSPCLHPALRILLPATCPLPFRSNDSRILGLHRWAQSCRHCPRARLPRCVCAGLCGQGGCDISFWGMGISRLAWAGWAWVKIEVISVPVHSHVGEVKPSKVTYTDVFMPSGVPVKAYLQTKEKQTDWQFITKMNGFPMMKF